MAAIQMAYQKHATASGSETVAVLEENPPSSSRTLPVPPSSSPTSSPSTPSILNASSSAPRQKRKLTVYDRFEASTDPSVSNPFSNRTPNLSARTKAVLLISGVVLAPLRLVMLTLAITLMGIFGGLSILGLSEKGLEKPLSCWRKILRSPAVFGVRLLLCSQGVWWIVEKGHRASAAEAPIVVANHTSFLDIMLVWSRRGAAVSKADNKDLPIFGPLAKSFQFIFVDRGDKNSRSKTAAEISKRAADSNWVQTIIFPEGTTTNGTAVITFKNGPFSPGRPVQAVAIKYHCHEQWGLDLSFVLGEPQMGGLGLRLLCVPWVAVTMTYLPVLTPSDAEKADATLFAARAQEALAAALGVPMTLHSFDDVRLADAAHRRHRLPVAAGVTEFKAIRTALNGIDVDTAKVYLKRFAAIGGSKDGLVSREEFSSLLLMEGGENRNRKEEDGAEEQPVFGFTKEEINRLFDLLDVDEKGSLDFKAFLVMMTFVNGDSAENRNAALRLAFRVFDEKDTGVIPLAALHGILQRGLPDLSAEELSALAEGADVKKDGQVTYEAFLSFAEAHADQLPTFKACFFGGISEGANMA